MKRRNNEGGGGGGTIDSATRGLLNTMGLSLLAKCNNTMTGIGGDNIRLLTSHQGLLNHQAEGSEKGRTFWRARSFHSQSLQADH